MRSIIISLGVVVCAVTALAQQPSPAPTPSDRATAFYGFGDVKYWSGVFDDPKRDAWQKPRELVAALALSPGATVADLGAGTGYFEPYLAAAVGPAGTVLAVEVEPTLVTHLRERAEREQGGTVVPVLASKDNPRLPAAAVDLILIADTYHHLDHRRVYLPQLHRALKPGGRIAVVDWKPGKLPEGPEPAHKLPRQTIIDEMRAAGFRLTAEPDMLPYHYVLIFE